MSFFLVISKQTISAVYSRFNTHSVVS